MLIPSTSPPNCPDCGKPLGTGEHCCTCRLHAGRASGGEAEIPRRRFTETGQSAPPSPPFQFGLSSLLLITTLAAVVMSVSVMVPGLGIALAVISAPALIRTYVVVRNSREEGGVASIQEKIVLFLVCLCVSGLIALATGAAFFVTCFVGFWGSSAVAGGGLGSLGLGFLVGGLLGMAAGVTVFILLFRLWFKRSPREAYLSTQRICRAMVSLEPEGPPPAEPPTEGEP